MKRNWKQETVRQWTASPCGAVESYRFGTPEFFEQVWRERYENYAPWLPETAGFSRAARRRVLEIGFGLGTDLTSFARGGAVTFGVDLTPRHAFAARRRFLQDGIPFRLVLGDAEKLPFRNGSFDVTYSFGVLHHTPGIASAIQELRRVLREDGRCWIALYHKHSLFWWYWILVEGVAKLGFLRDGIDGTLARIEFHSAKGAVPLVRAYGRRQLRGMFGDFHDVSVSCHHFVFSQAGALGRRLRPLLGIYEKRIAEAWGWYLVVQGRR